MLTNDLIQVAGIRDSKEAELLVSCGVKYLGFPLRLPVHKEDLSEKEAARIVRALKPPCYGVLITYLDRAKDIVEFCRELGTRIVQLHGEIRTGELRNLRRCAPGLTIIKSLVVGLHEAQVLERLVEASTPYVDGYITDTYDAVSGTAGATGKTHDWTVSRKLVELSRRPIILAGGLTPDNVRAAIAAVRPAGVDVHTGVERSSGRKDQGKVRRFIGEARAGFRALRATTG